MQVPGAHAHKPAPEPLELDDYFAEVHLDTKSVLHAGMDTRSQVRPKDDPPHGARARAAKCASELVPIDRRRSAFRSHVGAASGRWGSGLRTEEALRRDLARDDADRGDDPSQRSQCFRVHASRHRAIRSPSLKKPALPCTGPAQLQHAQAEDRRGQEGQ
jgi:hypothetical protein